MINISELLGINKKIILASQSPRRKKLLEQLGFELEIIPPGIDESTYSILLSPAEVAKFLAKEKALSVMKQVSVPALIIAADTIVVLECDILNKPETENEAELMLSRLSGKTHQVCTGITIADTETGRVIDDVQITKVTFRELSIEEIRAYIATGSPLDKAGAYGIQDDFGAVFVSNIVGCYYNIVGLPLEMLYSNLKKIREQR